jgi:hypothetical protein
MTGEDLARARIQAEHHEWQAMRLQMLERQLHAAQREIAALRVARDVALRVAAGCSSRPSEV